MDSLRDDGARKVLAGLTTVEEVLAATQEDIDVERRHAGGRLDARRGTSRHASRSGVSAWPSSSIAGIVAASGKQVHGVRDADNAKVLRAVLKREGVLLTSAQEEREGASGARRRTLDRGSLFRSA